jgi:putative chitinase
MRLWPHGDGRYRHCAPVWWKPHRLFSGSGIDTPLLIAHVMAQISHECGLAMTWLKTSTARRAG